MPKKLLFFTDPYSAERLKKLSASKILQVRNFRYRKKKKTKLCIFAMPVGKSNLLMGNDVPEILGKTNGNENRSKIVTIAESKQDADRLFNGLSAVGQIENLLGFTANRSI